MTKELREWLDEWAAHRPEVRTWAARHPKLLADLHSYWDGDEAEHALAGRLVEADLEMITLVMLHIQPARNLDARTGRKVDARTLAYWKRYEQARANLRSRGGRITNTDVAHEMVRIERSLPRDVRLDGEDERAGVDEEERRLHFRLDIGKANLTRPAERAQWYKLNSVDLENSGFDGESDKVGVVTSWDYPVVDLPKPTVADVCRAQDRIRNGGPWREDQRSKVQPWVGEPIAAALGLDLSKKPHKTAVNKICEDWVKVGWLTVVEARDERRKLRKFVEAGGTPVEPKFSKQGHEKRPEGDEQQGDAPVDEPARIERKKHQ